MKRAILALTLLANMALGQVKPVGPCRMDGTDCASSGGGTGILQLNGLTADPQSFAKVDDTNVTFGISSSGSTHTFTIAWTGTLASNRGGTENGFTAFTGPATSKKTFTLPNASATILTTNAAVTSGQGGNGADFSACSGLILFASGTGTCTTTSGSGGFARLTSPVFTTPNIGSATGSVSGNAGTATALAANPTDCSSGQYAKAIAAIGDLTCEAVNGAVTSTTLNVPHSTSLPGTCAVGDSYMDTDATSGARWYLCEATNTWAAQGGGGGGTPGGSDLEIQYNNAGAFGGLSFVKKRAAGLLIGPTGTNDTNADSMIAGSAAGKKGLVLQYGSASPTQPILQTQMSDGTPSFTVQTDGGVIIDQRTGATYGRMLDVKYAGVTVAYIAPGTNGIVAAGNGSVFIDGTYGLRTDGASTYTIGNGGSGFNGFYAQYTNTATVGAVTINKPSGRVNIAAAGTSVVVTNSLVTAASHVFVMASTADATARVTSVVPAAGSFTINTVATTAQTGFDFFVLGAD